MGCCIIAEERPPAPRLEYSRARRQAQEQPQDQFFCYSSFYELIEGQFANQNNYKCGNKYHWLGTSDSLTSKRAEFWETRVTGSPHVWEVLKAALENDTATGKLLLQAAEITMPHKTLNGCYDTQGVKYEIPAFCLNKPESYRTPKSRQIEMVSPGQVTFKVRASRFPDQDLNYEVPSSTPIAAIKQRYCEEKGVAQMRLFLRGYELKDDQLVGSHRPEGMVVQAYVMA